MKRHTAIYMKSMGYDESDWICCEVIGCTVQANDLHHIHNRKSGGSSDKDFIENLMAICRHHHIKYGDQKQYMDFLKYCHLKRLEERQVQFNPNLIKTDYL